MEEVARLAVIEQTLGNTDNFVKLLRDLLRLIDHILVDPHDWEARTLKGLYVKKALQHEVFCDYLKHVGFQLIDSEYTYPKEQALSKLRLAREAIQRKLFIGYGSKLRDLESIYFQVNKQKLKPVNFVTNNEFIRKIQKLFNDVLEYEDEELQTYALRHIPLKILQLGAVERVREYQRKLKNGEVTGNDLSFEIALLMELLGWFKYQFFSWMDRPDCKYCGGPTSHYINKVMKMETETCHVEIYKCVNCYRETNFPRYNDLITLLRVRTGRCGEWAKCFALLCRTLGYDTRYVYDTTDHVWCEVFDHVSSTWLHVDPCECLLNAPLTYSCGWNKKLSYVIAVSRDDIQDVTWRYTMDHKETLKRRNLCKESDLISSLLALREARQGLVSDVRRSYLIKRGLKELVELMTERKPSEYETQGRISGSKSWRKARREIATDSIKNTFQFRGPGHYTVQYYTASNKYKVCREGVDLCAIETFEMGAFKCENMFRKEETDWRQVYLAREEDEPTGEIAWKLAVLTDDLTFDELAVELNSTVYEDGKIECSIAFDDETPKPMILGETWHFQRRFQKVILSCRLSGGTGDVAWQHAQLFRQPLDSEESVFKITTHVTAA